MDAFSCLNTVNNILIAVLYQKYVIISRVLIFEVNFLRATLGTPANISLQNNWKLLTGK